MGNFTNILQDYFTDIGITIEHIEQSFELIKTWWLNTLWSSDALWRHVNICVGNGSLADGTRPLPELIVTYRQKGPLKLFSGHFHKPPVLALNYLSHNFIQTSLVLGLKRTTRSCVVGVSCSCISYSTTKTYKPRLMRSESVCPGESQSSAECVIYLAIITGLWKALSAKCGLLNLFIVMCCILTGR